MEDGNLDAAVLGLLAIGGSSYDVPRFAAEARAAAMRSGRPLVVFSPHPHVREAFAQAGVAVFRHEVEALVALEAFLAHRGAAGDASSSPPGNERSPSGQELERA